MSSVDAWAANQEDELGRSEAIRRLVELGLKSKAVMTEDQIKLKTRLMRIRSPVFTRKGFVAVR